MPSDYDEAKRRPPDRVSLVGVRLPPPPPKRPMLDDTEPTRPDVPHPRQRTVPGLGPVSEAPRSMSPVPGSIHLPDGSKVQKATLKHLWLWVGPVVVTIATSAFGYIRGYAKGLADAAERLAKIETRATELGKRVAIVEEREDAVEASEAAEANSNRAERATAMRKLSDFAADLETLKAAQPKIQGLPRKP